MKTVQAKFVSVWDFNLESMRGYEIITDCQINLQTGDLEIKNCSEEELLSVETFHEEYILLCNKRFHVKDDMVNPKQVRNWLIQLEKEELRAAHSIPFPQKNQKRL